jgi:hypothetical protein
VETADQLQDVLFASLIRRTYVWEGESSFDFWREARLTAAQSPEAISASQLVNEELVPISSSPIDGTSLAKLLAKGTAWTVSGEVFLHDPLEGVGLFFAVEFGVVIAHAARGLGVGLEWRIREWLRVPPDFRDR